MGKFIIIGIIGYVAIGLIFVRYFYTVYKRRFATKQEGIGCAMFAVFLLWPLAPIAAFVTSGGKKEEKKRNSKIKALTDEKNELLDVIYKWNQLTLSDPECASIYKSVYDYNMPRIKQITKEIEDLKSIKPEGQDNGH